MSELKNLYRDKVIPALLEKFLYKNTMLVPRLVKVVINMGLAKQALQDKNVIEHAAIDLAALSGQKPQVRRARKSISNFKLREGQAIGLKVTLRGEKMWDFVYRFCAVTCPRIRDFRGFPVKFDGRGNYTLGLNDQQMFSEINLDDVRNPWGMKISFVTTARSDDEAQELLTLLGFPFARKKKKLVA